ncbi:MAG: DUF4347 domain-containing protein, partial [Leptothrix sp. (in: b-proteobacteria)]
MHQLGSATDTHVLDLQAREVRSSTPAAVPTDAGHSAVTAPADPDTSHPAVTRHEVAFVDTTVAGYQALIDGIGGKIEVVLLDSSKDGLDQIAHWAQTHSGYDAIHILSHGSAGKLQLGTTAITSDELESRHDDLTLIGNSLKAGGDLLIYGCSIGANSQFIEQIASLTHADVAASNDPTGSAALGGNWNLETQVGQISKESLAEQVLFSGFDGLLATPANGLYTFINAVANNTTHTATTADGFFVISGKDGSGATSNVAADGYGAYIVNSTAGTTYQSYLEIKVASTGSFTLTTADVGEYRATTSIPNTQNDFSNVYVAGYANGTQIAATTPISSIGAFNQHYSIDYSPFANKLVDTIRVYYTVSTTTLQTGFNLASITISSASTTAAPIVQTITSGAYDASTGTLSVTGSNMTAGDSIDVTKLTLTGEGGQTYTLTSNNVTASSSSAFSVALNATDQAAINQIFNKAGTSSTGGTSFNLAGATGWDATKAAAADISNGVTVSNVATPTITSATYDASTHVLTVNGSGFLKLSGAANDINVSKLSLSGDSTAYTLTSSSVEINSGTSFAVTLNATDAAALVSRLTRNGTSSIGGTTYNLSAAEDWASGAAAAVNVADLTGNGITVSNEITPPVFSSAVTSVDGRTITLTYNEPLNATNLPDVAAFGVTSAGNANAVASVAVSGSTITLTLTHQIRTGQSVSVTYTDPSPSNDVNAIQDSAGNDAANLAQTTVTNNTRANVTFGAAYRLYDNGVNLGTGGGYSPRDIAINDGSGAPLIAGTAIVGNISFVASATYSSGTGTFQLQGNDLQGTLTLPNGTTITGSISYHDRDAGGSGDKDSSDSEMFLFIVPSTGEAYALMTDGNTVGTNATDGNKSLKSGDAYLTTETNIGVSADKNSLISNLNSYLTEQIIAASAIAPIVTTSGGASAFTEGANVTSTPVRIDSGLTLGDADSSTLARATVSITGNFRSSEDVLAFSNDASSMGNITASYSSSTGVMTLTSADASATVAQWQAALRSITYTNSSDTPDTGSRTVSFVVNDGLVSSSTATRTVTVSPANDAPTADAVSASGAQDAAAISVMLSGTDIDGSIASYSIATLPAHGTLYSDAALTQAVLAATPFNAATLYFVPTPNWNGSTSFDYTTTDNAGATSAAAATASISVTPVSHALADQMYDPDTLGIVTQTNSAATLHGLTYSAHSGGSLDPNVSVEIINTGLLSSGADHSLVYRPATSHTLSDVSFKTADGSEFKLNSFDVANQNWSLGGSSTYLYIEGYRDGQLIVSSGIDISANGTGTFNVSGNNAWANLDEICIKGTDLIVELDNLDFSTAVPNVPPVVTTSSGSAAFVEGANVASTPVVIDSGLTLGDSDSTTLASATVSISGNFHSGEDLLAFVNDGSTMGNIAASYNAGTGVLSMTSAGASANVAEWQAALRAVTYGNSSDTPDTTTRTLSYVVNDGLDPSSAATRSVTVAASNDAPTTSAVTLTAIAEDSGARLITQAELLANAGDVDNVNLTATSLAITAGNGALVDNGDGTWSYTPAANDDGSVSFSYSVSDGSLTASGSASLDITPVNDAPTTAAVTLAAIAEDSGSRLITQAELLANAGDIDSGSLTASNLAITSGSGALTDNGDGTWTYTPASNDD